jgi:tetratricopeptide (TPR) repeat protein
VARIYVSSTFLDLRTYRAEVRETLRRLGHTDVAMEYYVAEDRPSVERCLADVAECAAYVGIFAWRYGWRPANGNPGRLSITEMEYRQAQALGKPCFIFFQDERGIWPPNSVDTGADAESVTRLRAAISEDHHPMRFTNADNLCRALAEALANSPLAARARKLHNLRAPVADFTGRTDDLAALKAALSPGGTPSIAHVTGLHGLGGVGKTELALKAAHELDAAYPDAALLFECQPGGVPLSPAALIAGVIRVYDTARRLPDDLPSLQGIYCEILAGRQGLLLLDNARDAAQVAPLLPPPAGWGAIVTSRAHFGLPGAHRRSLDVLPPPDAAELLSRVLGAGGRADLAAGPLDELARRCGYLPLALRVAASYLCTYNNWSLDAYLAALRRAPLQHLREGAADVAAVLGFSVTQLVNDNPTLARRWAGLAVFPAPFDVSAAAAVWDAPPDDALAPLGELCALSLLEYRPKEQLYTLHDLLRQYALTIPLGLDPPPDFDALRLRHAQYYLQVGQDADNLYEQGGDNILAALSAFDAAWPHLAAAWAWARDREDEPSRRWLSDFPGYLLANFLSLRLAPRQHIPILEAALAAARRLKDRRDEGIHLGNLGGAYYALGEPQRAIAYYEQHLEIARAIGDRRGEGQARGNLGIAYDSLGEPQRAIAYYEQDLEIARAIGDRRGEGQARGNLGLAYYALGEPQQAIAYYEQQLEITCAIGDRRGEGLGSWNLGLLYEQQGDCARAAALMQVCVDYERAIGHPDAEKDAQYVALVRSRGEDAAGRSQR